jgi:hypothetical protein
VFSWAPGDELLLGTTRNLGLLVWAISLSAATATTVDIHAKWVE